MASSCWPDMACVLPVSSRPRTSSTSCPRCSRSAACRCPTRSTDGRSMRPWRRPPGSAPIRCRCRPAVPSATTEATSATCAPASRRSATWSPAPDARRAPASRAGDGPAGGGPGPRRAAGPPGGRARGPPPPPRPRPGPGPAPPSPRLRQRRRARRARPPHGARLPGARRLMRVALLLAGPATAPRGSQVLVRQLALGLAARGHVVRLVTYGGRRAGPPGPRVGRLLSDLWLTGRLWRLVAREPIDVVHAHNYEAAIAGLVVARLTGRPLVYHGHSALAEELPLYFTNPLVRRLAARLGRSLDAQVPRRADFCIAVPAELAALLRRRGVAAAGLACIGPAGTPEELGPPPAARGAGGLACSPGRRDG